MHYIITLKNGKTIEFNNHDALFEVNRKMKENEHVKLLFSFYHEYEIDFQNKAISVDGKKLELEIPETSEPARWINQRKVTVDFNPDGTKDFTEQYMVGFQITIGGKNYKRILYIDNEKYRLGDN